jgi:hypothetical protein
MRPRRRGVEEGRKKERGDRRNAKEIKWEVKKNREKKKTKKIGGRKKEYKEGGKEKNKQKD